MNNNTRWLSYYSWTCGRHLVSCYQPANRATCYLSTCSKYCNGRPNEELRPLKPPENSLCSWIECDKGFGKTRAIKRPGSKYCSRKCSNSNARQRFKDRCINTAQGDLNGTTGEARA